MKLKRELSWLCQQGVKHSVQDNTVVSKKTIVHFNFHERSELTSIFTS